MTKKKGRTLEMTVKEGAKAQIHCPLNMRSVWAVYLYVCTRTYQEAWKRKNRMVMRYTYPDVEESVGSPVGQYQRAQ
jgi:hypothetical protein